MFISLADCRRIQQYCTHIRSHFEGTVNRGVLAAILSLGLLAACETATGDAESCTTVDNEDGTYTLSCPDGSEVVLANGQPGGQGEPGEQGDPGEPCTAVDNHDNTYTITCPDGSSFVLSDGEKGEDGAPGKDGEDGTNVLVRAAPLLTSGVCRGSGERLPVHRQQFVDLRCGMGLYA